ncbi:MAG: ribonuclease P protein component [Candidatus Jorgensenbacteria bacterium]
MTEIAAPLKVKIGTRRPHAAPLVIVLGNAVERSAVARNRMRRRVRAVLKKKAAAYTGKQVVVILRRPALSLTFGMLRDELLKQFSGTR